MPALTLEPPLAPTQAPLQNYGYLHATGCYFGDPSGKPFMVLGQNDGLSWPGLEPLWQRRDPAAAERYLVDLCEHGTNVLRIMVEYAQDEGHFFENPVGTFNPAAVQFWDDLIALAWQHNLRLLLTPFDTYWQAKNWERHPYNAANGGPCQTRHDFLTAPEAIAAQKRRFQFMIDRWGKSDAIFAWDLMNEIDLWWLASPGEMRAWVDEMSDFVGRTEQERWGRANMLTVSSAESVPNGELADLVYRHPRLSFASTHLYGSQAMNDPEDTVGVIDDVALAVRYARKQTADKRPFMDSESGPIDAFARRGQLPEAFDTELFHNASWAHLACGGAGQGLRWPYRDPHVLTAGMRDTQLAMARIIAGAAGRCSSSHAIAKPGWWKAPLRDIGDDLEPVGACYHLGLAGEGKALIWLRRKGITADGSAVGPSEGLRVEWSNPPGEYYVVTWWDPWTGQRLTELDFASRDDARMMLVSPAFAKDIVALLCEIYYADR